MAGDGVIPPTVLGVHLQSCDFGTCTGCYPLPPPKARPSKDLGAPSADRLRTIRRQELIESGRNPATKRPLLVGTSETCGTCTHCVLTHGGSRSYWKCDLVPITGGAGTDIRKSWPACTEFGRRRGL